MLNKEGNKRMKKIDLTGQRFGRLTVLREGDGQRQPNGRTVRTWICKCDCGNEVEVRQPNLTRKEFNTVSCGCYAREDRAKRMHEMTFKHGCRKDRLYAVWCGMKRRCEKEYDPEYSVYGGRGISVCDEWKDDYLAFKDWAYSNGYDPSKKRGECTIDRIDNNKGYSPDNCRIANMKEQANNTSTVLHYDWRGDKYTLTEIMKLSGTKYSRTCLHKRLKKGMSVDDALTLPLMINKYAFRKGESA